MNDMKEEIETKDQLIALLGLIAVVVVTGTMLVSYSSSTGEVAGVKTDKREAQTQRSEIMSEAWYQTGRAAMETDEAVKNSEEMNKETLRKIQNKVKDVKSN